MFNYLIRRLLISAITLVIISMVIFGILKIAPGDPLAGFANNPNVPIEVRAKIRKNMGLDDPIPLQYAKWAREYVRGDWGQSFLSRAPAREIIFNRLPTTLKIVGSAYLISVMIAIPIGVISALKQYSAFDQISTTFAFLGFSLPTFFSGLVLIVIFSFKLDWFPFVYDKTVTGFWPNVKQSDPADHGVGSGRLRRVDAVRPRLDARGDQPGLRANRTGKRPAGAERDRVSCDAQCDDPGRDNPGPANSDHLRRRDHHRADLSDPGYRLFADRINHSADAPVVMGISMGSRSWWCCSTSLPTSSMRCSTRASSWRNRRRRRWSSTYPPHAVQLTAPGAAALDHCEISRAQKAPLALEQCLAPVPPPPVGTGRPDRLCHAWSSSPLSARMLYPTRQGLHRLHGRRVSRHSSPGRIHSAPTRSGVTSSPGMLWGGRISLAVGVISATVAITIGTLVGAIAGFFGGASRQSPDADHRPVHLAAHGPPAAHDLVPLPGLASITAFDREFGNGNLGIFVLIVHRDCRP